MITPRKEDILPVLTYCTYKVCPITAQMRAANKLQLKQCTTSKDETSGNNTKET